MLSLIPSPPTFKFFSFLFLWGWRGHNTGDSGDGEDIGLRGELNSYRYRLTSRFFPAWSQELVTVLEPGTINLGRFPVDKSTSPPHKEMGLAVLARSSSTCPPLSTSSPFTLFSPFRPFIPKGIKRIYQGDLIFVSCFMG